MPSPTYPPPVPAPRRVPRPLLVALVLAPWLLVACAGDDDPVPAGQATGPFGWVVDKLPPTGKPVRRLEREQGLVIDVLAEGEGDVLDDGAPRDLQYRLYLLDGRLVQTGTMQAFVPTKGLAGASIRGFAVGASGMRMMERRRLFIPAVLGYGAGGQGDIPPNARLVFDIRPVRLVREDVVVGDGAEARPESTVTVHYEGRLQDGTIFDSSYVRGSPVTLALRAFVPGWRMGVEGMRVGGKRTLWIPFHLAYDAQPAPGGKVPPYSDLSFTVELLGVR